MAPHDPIGAAAERPTLLDASGRRQIAATLAEQLRASLDPRPPLDPGETVIGEASVLLLDPVEPGCPLSGLRIIVSASHEHPLVGVFIVKGGHPIDLAVDPEGHDLARAWYFVMPGQFRPEMGWTRDPTTRPHSWYYLPADPDGHVDQKIMRDEVLDFLDHYLATRLHGQLYKVIPVMTG